MKIKTFITIILSILTLIPLSSGCITKKRVLVIECPTDKPNELNKEGFKKEIKREKSLEKENRSRNKEKK